MMQVARTRTLGLTLSLACACVMSLRSVGLNWKAHSIRTTSLGVRGYVRTIERSVCAKTESWGTYPS